MTIELTKAEQEILMVYIQYPFATHNQAGHISGHSSKFIPNAFRNICERAGVPVGVGNRLCAFTALGWIKPSGIEYPTEFCSFGFKGRHRPILDILTENPQFSTIEIHRDMVGYQFNTVSTYLSEMYRVSGVPDLTLETQQTARLRFYANLGWYRPVVSNWQTPERKSKPIQLGDWVSGDDVGYRMLGG